MSQMPSLYPVLPDMVVVDAEEAGPASPAPIHPTRSLTSRFLSGCKSAFNNMVNAQYIKPKFSTATPIWLLGTMYGDDGPALLAGSDAYGGSGGDGAGPADMSQLSDGFVGVSRSSSGSSAGSGGGGGGAGSAAVPSGGSASAHPHIQALMSDILSRPWMTYREGFAPILSSKYTSDVGWGCMIRSAQMMLAHSLFVHVLGRDFRFDGDESVDVRHRNVLALFADVPDERAPFSIHNMLRHAAEDGVTPGSWLGPSMVCRTLCRAVNQERRAGVMLRVYLALDCLVSKERVEETMLSSGQAWCPLLILIPLRLGTQQINLAYVPALQRVLANAQCVGILGGKPRHSLYFIGFQGSEMVGLDPHACRAADDPTDKECTLKSYHCNSPRKVNFSGIDPSIALGFFCQTREELEAFYAFSVEETDAKVKPLYSMSE